MLAAKGILTARGGLVSHAAVVARGWGKPAVVGAEAVKIEGRSFKVGSTIVAEGEWISLDGTTGQVVVGKVSLTQAESPPELETLLEWADSFRDGVLKVRANADTGADAANARRLGAEGIGLCRTEHMFLGEDRLPVVRRMILAATEEAERDALEELRAAQKEDFVSILEAMDGLPVTVRLLDPPLHEFLPDTSELAVKDATVGLSEEERTLYRAALEWREENPMLGTRGVRFGVMKPGLYAMQVRALMEAAVERVEAGGRPVIEVMIPLTVGREEMALARGWVEQAVASVIENAAPKSGRRSARAEAQVRANGVGELEVTIGTMIETPRAALRAGEIAEVAEFFSFGTNDLTQMTFGFSRDDVEGRMMSAYLEQGLLKRNPFETIDADGVGELVRIATERGRAARPSLKIGVCGEHGGDPESISLFEQVGLDYVSCSPFRVPIARLAGAQAVLASGRGVSARKAGAARKPGAAKKAGPVRKVGSSREGRQSIGDPQAPLAGPERRRLVCQHLALPSCFVAIPEEDVARVRAATDIVALIGEHAGLKRQGRRFVGLCPFHEEKTPSFSVNAEEGIYYCFGCQASGDAITFVRATEHLDFVEAVRRLADRAGITITEDEAVVRRQPQEGAAVQGDVRRRRLVPRAPSQLPRRRIGA